MLYVPNEESRDYDDDERFYEETVYNEQYYLEREQELIRESNLEIETEELDGNNIRDRDLAVKRARYSSYSENGVKHE